MLRTGVGADGAIAPIIYLVDRFIVLNLVLAVFNMIPVPPLDGGNVLAGVLRGSAAEAFNRLRPWGFLLLYALMFSGILFAVITPVMNGILSLLL
jgi:Zn-dependent protease